MVLNPSRKLPGAQRSGSPALQAGPASGEMQKDLSLC